MRINLPSIILFCALLTGCSSVPEEDKDPKVNDPFEGFNRAIWTLNYEYLDPYVARPVSLAYVNGVPSSIRHRISGFLSNLDEPASMVNNLLMGNGKQAFTHFNRFWINTTFGLLGLFDVASVAGIQVQEDKEFSDAVGYYGVGNGPYLMLPGYGPLTTREVTNTVDTWYAPLSLLNIWAKIGKWTIEGMETRAALVSQESMLDNSPDPYRFTRDIYLQRRDYKAERVKDTYNEEEEDYLDDYLDDFMNDF